MTLEQIKEKMQYGDYKTLARYLGLKNTATAKMRFIRGNKEAIIAMEKIVLNREAMIEEAQNQ